MRYFILLGEDNEENVGVAYGNKLYTEEEVRTYINKYAIKVYDNYYFEAPSLYNADHIAMYCFEQFDTEGTFYEEPKVCPKQEGVLSDSLCFSFDLKQFNTKETTDFSNMFSNMFSNACPTT